MKRLACSVVCLLLMSWSALANDPVPTSRELLTQPLTAEAIASMLGPETQYSGSEIATWLAVDLLPVARSVIQETAQSAAAEAARPLLAELAGVTAERDAGRQQVRRWRTVGILALVTAALGWLLAAAT